MKTLLKLDLFQWFFVIAITVSFLLMQNQFVWLKEFPKEFIFPLSAILNSGMEWVVDYSGWFFKGISWFLEWPIKGVRWLLHFLPWTVTVFLFCLVSYIASGWGLVTFTLLATFYMVLIGYWMESMNSFSLVAISVPMAVLVGFAIGSWGFFSERAEKVIKPTLDFLQTVPAFAYLLPILLLFGFGTTVGLLASLIYSFPPMVRNTILGLRQVPSEIIESGIMSGASSRQLFWLVRVPTAWKQILLGVNQTTMASLSMVIIASIIGGTADIGWEVLVYLRKAEFGGSLVAGIVIALIAMILDRITSGLAKNSVTYKPREKSFLRRNKFWFLAITGVLFFYIMSFIFPILNQWPESYFISPAKFISNGLDIFILNFGTQIDYLKQVAFFFIMLPVKIGLQLSVSPYTWGFELTPFLITAYFIIMMLFASWCFLKFSKDVAIGIILFSIFIYFGLTNMPWLPLILIYGLIGFKIGGLKLSLTIVASFLFITFTGVLPQALLSIYLCGIAVIISFILGSSLGIWAAHNDKVSAFMRPINDTMQTMPSFVILIPFVMFFGIGEFTALLAIIAYAFVPAMRYTEHGLRNLPETVIEAARMIGCSQTQLLWKVKIPLAMPVIMLGLNQTIMFGLAMLVIAALVGTTGLGQLIYIGLSKADFGTGMISGVSIALIAIIFDRTTQAWRIKLEKKTQ